MTDRTLNDGGKHRVAQTRTVRRDGWTKDRRTTFLRSLAATCNVRRSCEAAGMSSTGVYDLRRRDAAFAALWDEALAMGYDRLEALLLQRAIEGINDIDTPALVGAADAATAGDGNIADAGEARARPRPGSGVTRAMARTDVQLALALLNRRSGGATALRAGTRKRMSADEVDALLTRRLDALAKRRGGA